MRVPKGPADPPGKGSFWAIHPDHAAEFKNGVFTGKIRGAEYRQLAKYRGRRSSVTSDGSMSVKALRRQDSTATVDVVYPF